MRWSSVFRMTKIFVWQSPTTMRRVWYLTTVSDSQVFNNNYLVRYCCIERGECWSTGQWRCCIGIGVNDELISHWLCWCCWFFLSLPMLLLVVTVKVETFFCCCCNFLLLFKFFILYWMIFSSIRFLYKANSIKFHVPKKQFSFFVVAIFDAISNFFSEAWMIFHSF